MPTSAEDLSAWEQAVEHVRRRSPATFEQWFSHVQLDSFEASVLRLAARNEFVLDWVRTHFQPSLTAYLNGLHTSSSADGIRVEWRLCAELSRPVCEFVEKRGATPGRPPSVRPPSVPPASEARGRSRLHSDRPAANLRGSRSALASLLNPKHTFANFVVGSSNELAYAAALGSAGGGGKRYNPLFIAGRTGLGKTHLIQAIAHQVMAERPSARIVYVSAEHFTNEFIEALQNRRMEEFRLRYRGGCDLLLLDDIQFLAGREQTQEEFFHTFNALHDVDKPIVVTSDKYPQQLQRMPDRLVSRFTSGLVADIQVPRLETRVAIVRKKAELEGIDAPDEVAVLLAQSIQSNVRELEGALIRLAAKSSLTGQPINVEFARSELAMVTPQRQQVSVEDIQQAVCGHFSLSSAELLSKDRHKSVAFARQVAMYLCRQRLKCSFPELGRAFGNRDHTTVMSAVRRIAAQVEDPQVKAHLDAIEERLASSS